MCSKGGVVEFYKLPLSLETLQGLWKWTEVCESVSGLSSMKASDAPYEKWSDRQLCSRTSWIGKESWRLARAVAKETGRKVIANAPPISPFYL